ncbi:MAG: tRNA1(Val) (adenine(37)-N6)-methyltransferase [Paracoccaceae bacterium]
MFADDDLTQDGFLGGRLTLWQPKAGFRSSVDAVLLAAAVPAKAGESVLDLGCGAGAAALCLGARIAGLRLAGLELQAGYAALARRNAALNAIALEVWEGDALRQPQDLRSLSFDHVVTNPPYFRGGDGTAALDAGREAALRSAVPATDWIAAALRRLRPGGWLTLIQSADRLPEVLAALPGGGRGAAVMPVLPRRGRVAGRFLLRARKGGRSAFALLPPLVLHEGAAHLRDGEDFSPRVRAILRGGAALDWPG